MGLIVNFSDFENISATNLSVTDYVIGYRPGPNREIRSTIEDFSIYIQSLSSNNVYVAVTANSANWNSTYSTVRSLSDTWEESVFITPLQVASGSWDSVYSTVNSNSSRYTTLDYLSTNNVLLSAVTVAGNVSITNGLSANTIFTTGSGNVIIDRGNYRRNTDPTIIIGANSDQHLRFRAGGATNSQIRMTILSSGEVGIGTTIAQTRSPVISAINGGFQNTTGLTPIDANWYHGVPSGWTSPFPSPTYSIFNAGGGDLVANPSTLAIGSGSSSLRQNLGTLQTMSDINVTFDYADTSIASWSNGTLNVAIYDGSFNVLATNSYTTPSTYSLIAAAVPAGTTIIVGFWATTISPGLNNVTVTQTDKNNLTIVGSISATGNLSIKNIDTNNGNSNQWNSNYTSFNTQSAANASVYTSFNTQSAANASVYTSFNTQSAANASVYTSFNTQSAANASVYTTLNANSAS
jgi:hypothetical protein